MLLYLGLIMIIARKKSFTISIYYNAIMKIYSMDNGGYIYIHYNIYKISVCLQVRLQKPCYDVCLGALLD